MHSRILHTMRIRPNHEVTVCNAVYRLKPVAEFKYYIENSLKVALSLLKYLQMYYMYCKGRK